MIVNAKKAAKMLGLDPTTVTKACSSGKIKEAVKAVDGIWEIPVSCLKKYWPDRLLIETETEIPLLARKYVNIAEAAIILGLSYLAVYKKSGKIVEAKHTKKFGVWEIPPHCLKFYWPKQWENSKLRLNYIAKINKTMQKK